MRSTARLIWLRSRNGMAGRRLTGIITMVVLLAVAGTSGLVAAQPSVQDAGPGTRVRISFDSLPTAQQAGAPRTTFTGVLLNVDAQTISIKPDRASSSLTIPRAAISKVERADGHRSRWRYAGFGALIGAGAGAFAGGATTSCEPHEFFCSTALGALAGAIAGGAVGAAAGAIIPPPERWVVIDQQSLSGTVVSPLVLSPAPKRRRRFAVAFELGHPTSGPADDVENAMRAGGFGDTAPAFFGPPIDHPFSRTGFWEIGRPFAFEVDYSWTPSWSIGFVESRTPIGETFGYRSAEAQYLFVQYQVATTGIVVLKDYRFVRGGVGVSVHRAQARQDPNSAIRDDSWAGDSHLGMLALAGVRLPTDTRAFLDVHVQYRWLASTSVGPFTVAPFPSAPATLLPAFDSQFSHWFVAFGPGVRF